MGWTVYSPDNGKTRYKILVIRFYKISRIIWKIKYEQTF